MFNPFKYIVKGFTWLGKEVVSLPELFFKFISYLKTVEDEGDDLIKPLQNILTDVSDLGVASVKDGGACLTALETLVAAIVAAAKTDGLNLASDLVVMNAAKDFFAAVAHQENFVDVITAWKKMLVDLDSFGKEAVEFLNALEGKGSPTPTTPVVVAQVTSGTLPDYLKSPSSLVQ